MQLRHYRQFSISSIAVLCLASFCTTLTATPVALANARRIEIAQSQPQSRTRIAVLDFQLASTSGDAALRQFFQSSDLGRGISELLTDKLVQSDQYSVIERARLEEILREQGLAATGQIDPSTAAKIGQILGVEYVVLGSITQLDFDRNRTGGNLCLPIVGCVGGGVKNNRAEIELTARLVNTSTAQIVSSASGQGVARVQDTQVVFRGGGIETDRQNFAHLFSVAADKAIDQLVDRLTGSTGFTGSTREVSLSSPASPIVRSH